MDYTDQGRRTIKDSPGRAEAAKAEAVKLGIQVKDIFFTPGGLHIPTQIDTHSAGKTARVPIEIGTGSEANRHPLFRVR